MLDMSDACRVGNTTAVKVPVVTAMFLHEVCLLCDEIIRGQEFPEKITDCAGTCHIRSCVTSPAYFLCPQALHPIWRVLSEKKRIVIYKM